MYASRVGLGTTLLSSSTLLTRRGPYPVMSLNFLSGSLDSRVTFTRGSNATFVGSNGLIQTAGNNVARFDYDPVTLQPRGLLIEEQRVNLLLQSQAFDDAAWTKTGSATVTANAATAPDGAVTADQINGAAVASTGAFNFPTGLSVGVLCTFSVYIKNVSGATSMRIGVDANPNIACVRFNAATGQIISQEANVVSSSVTNAGNGWYRVNVTFTSTAGSAGCVVFNTTGLAATWLAWGAQLEQGAFATSFIPTVASTVTRSADVATMTGTNFSSWYNQSEGAFVVNADTYHVASVRMIFAASDGTSSNENGGYVNSTAALQGITIAAPGGTQALVASGSATANTPFKLAYAYATNNFGVSGNGATVATDSIGTVPTVNRLTIGLRGDSSLPLNGHIRQIAYYNSRLANAQLQSLTS